MGSLGSAALVAALFAGQLGERWSSCALLDWKPEHAVALAVNLRRVIHC